MDYLQARQGMYGDRDAGLPPGRSRGGLPPGAPDGALPPGPTRLALPPGRGGGPAAAETSTPEPRTGGPGAAHIHDEAFSANRTYEPSPKHAGRDRVAGGRKISKEPTDGDAALNFSFDISPNSDRRIGIDVKHGEFVVFDRTGDTVVDKQAAGGVYHGHVRTWDELEAPMRRVLIDHDVVKKGKINVDPDRWDLTP